VVQPKKQSLEDDMLYQGLKLFWHELSFKKIQHKGAKNEFVAYSIAAGALHLSKKNAG